MLRKIFTSASIMMILTLFIMISIPTLAQDTEPTPIPVLPETTEDSAAPLAPGIQPPAVDATQAIAPEATAEVVPDVAPTEAVGDTSTDTNAPTGDTNTCPVGVSDSFTAVEILCADTNDGEACIGNGTVNATFNGDVEGAFAQANDRTQLTSLDRIELVSNSTWTVMRFQPQLATTDGGDLATAVAFAYGNVTLTDTGQVQSESGARSGTIIADRGMNVRRTPGSDGVVVWQLAGGQQVTVTGRTVDQEWIRIIIPNEFAGTGWVYAPYVNVEGGTDTLEFVTVNSPQPDLSAPQFAPGQSYELLSEPAPADCTDVPNSGLLIQTPSGTPDALRLQINNAEIQMSGTVFIEALIGEVLRISVLEGSTTVIGGGSQRTATANNRINVPLDVNLVVNGVPSSEAFDPNELLGLPMRLVPRGIAFDQVAITTEVEPTTDTATTTETAPTTATDVPATCTLTAPDEVRNIRAGASTEFETVQVLQPGESVEGIGQTVGELNLTWYQTVNGGWIRIDTIEPSANCGSLPTVEPPALPDPTEAPAPTSNLSASNLAALTCDGTSSITGSATSDGSNLYVAIGGTWTATAGTTATFNTQGGMLRPELGSYVVLVAEDGTEIANSGEGRSLAVTFENDATFEARFSAANGDTVVMAVSCGG